MSDSRHVQGTEGEAVVKEAVKSFYDQVGWQRISDGRYQNTTYEDLRPVSREYIHKCHLRIMRHLKAQGKLLLDAGSGPIQYVEYLEYSRGYQFRVCADLSIVALREARHRIGEHGLFVVADIANLPFKDGCFEGIVSLHTIHHLPIEEHIHAYREIYRLLDDNANAVVVDGWRHSQLMDIFSPIIKFRNRLAKQRHKSTNAETSQNLSKPNKDRSEKNSRGTFVEKYNAAWLKKEIERWMHVQIFCWRSVSVQFLRVFIHPRFGGRQILWLVYWLEERFPQFFGETGQYPIVVVSRIGQE